MRLLQRRCPENQHDLRAVSPAPPGKIRNGEMLPHRAIPNRVINTGGKITSIELEFSECASADFAKRVGVLILRHAASLIDDSLVV